MSDFQDNTDEHYNPAIAVIGMSGVFPGADSVQELWQMLREGRDGLIPAFEEHGLQGPVASVNRAYKDNPDFVGKVYGLKNKARFDAAFFGIPPREAELMDPQHRIFLENAWSALEHACVIPDETDVPVGVYGSCGFNAYLANNLSDLLSPDAPMSSYFETLVGNDKEYLATRTSYKLNLTGPSMVVQTACSSSLTAIIMACQGLRDYQCDLALAGGSSIQINQDAGYLPEEDSPLSLRGITRAFDNGADGVAGGSGCAVVVLKRLEEALEDGDVIYSIIRGYGLNNDGSDKVNFTAPSIGGQSRAIAEAMADAGIEPSDIGYIECHGTGTAIGDPIEIASLSKIFKPKKEHGKIPIGTIKTNVGHLDTAAGAAALIKTSLALHHEEIPPCLNFETPNSRIDFASTPFELCLGLKPWPRGKAPRYAAVSSFGFGGTNAHIIIEEGPRKIPAEEPVKPVILPLSARNGAALDKALKKLGEALPEQGLAAAASTLQLYRKRFEERAALVCSSAAEYAALLQNPAALIRNKTTGDKPELIFKFSASTDYAVEAIEKLCRESDRVAQTFTRLLDGKNLACYLKQPESVLSVSFMLESGLAAQLKEWGILPDAISWEGYGLFAAAVSAGLMPEREAFSLASALGELSLTHGCKNALEAGKTLLREKLAAIKFSPTTARLVSPQSGNTLGKGELGDPEAWFSLLKESETDSAVCRNNTLVLPLGENYKSDYFSGLLKVAAYLWTRGFEPAWGNLPAAQNIKTGLPGYSFQGERYWRKPVSLATASTGEASKRPSLDDWFMEPVWMKSPYMTGALNPEGNWLIFHSPESALLAEELSDLLKKSAGNIIMAAKGDKYAEISEARYTLRPGNDKDISEMLQSLASRKALPDHVIGLWPLDYAKNVLEPPLDAARMENVRAGTLDMLVTLMRNLAASQSSKVRLSLFTRSIFDITGERPDPLLYMLQAALLTAMWEYPEYSGSITDMGDEAPKAGIILREALTAGEPAYNGQGMLRAYRGGLRWLRNYISVRHKANTATPDLQGPVLITGGLGGVGLAYASMLAKAGAASLVLAGRKPLPPEPEWISQPYGSPAAILARLKAETGVNILTLALDCADCAALEKAVSTIEAEHGKFRGVVHAAGVPGSGMIVSALPEGSASNFHAKVAALRALDEVFRERSLAFVHLCSSLSAITGALGQVDNCAANLVLDGYAFWAEKNRPWPVTSINWDRWQGVGMAKAVEERHASASGEELPSAMHQEDAREAARRLLSCPAPQVLVGNRCPFALTRQMLAGREAPQKAAVRPDAEGKHKRPDIGIDFVAPRDELEKTLANLWSASLGVDRVGADDEFTRLGGDSLLAISLMSNIRKVFRTNAPLPVLFRVKTVSGLAGWLRDNESKPGITDKIARIICSTDNAKQAVMQD